MNGVIIQPSPVGICSTVSVTILLSIKTNPFRTRLRPLYLLACGWFVRHKEERFACWQLNRFCFVAVRSAAVVQFSVLVVNSIRENATFIVLVKPVFVVPCYVTWFQSFGARTFLVNTVFASRKEKRVSYERWGIRDDKDERVGKSWI